MVVNVIGNILAFSFVTPAFVVAGLALAGIPILIHILNRRRFKTLDWAAMEFLLRAMRKNRRRIQFEQWLLLATRCLVFALLGFALARPFGCQGSGVASALGQRSGMHVFVIDNSYSMAYQANRPEAKTHLDQARRLAIGLVDRLGAGGESAAVIVAGQPAAVVVHKSTDLEGVRSAIERIEQSASGTDLAGALELALQIGRDNSTEPRLSLYLFTDATRSAWEGSSAAALEQAGRELASIYRFTHFNLGRNEQWNHAALDVRPVNNLVTTKLPPEFVANVKGYGPGPESHLIWKLDDRPLSGGGTIALDPATPEQLQSQVSFRTGGAHTLSVTLHGDDRLPIDDVRHRVLDVAAEMKVLIVEGERGINPLGGSATFLELALAPLKEAGSNNSGGRTNSYVQPETISDLELGNRVLHDYRAVILAGVGQIQPAQADQLQRFVNDGGMLMLFMGESVSGDNYNATLLPRRLLPGPMTRRVSVASDQHGYLFDFRPRNPHPLLNAFRDEAKSGLNTAQVFAYWQVDVAPDAKVERVLDYLPREGAPMTGEASSASQRDPAITVHSVGSGRVVFFSTTANPDWTTLPVKTAYVTLMHELLAGSVSTPDRWLNLSVGEALEVPSSVKLTIAPELTDPAGKTVVLTQATTSEGSAAYRSEALSLPGLYKLSTGVAEYPVAVNPPADEADIRTLNNETLRAALGGIGMVLEGDTLPPIASSIEDGNDFGWSVMMIVLVLVGLESFMAMRFGHYRR